MKQIWATLCAMAVIAGSVAAYSILKAPQPLTIDQCRDLTKDSDTLKKMLAGYGATTDRDQEDAIEAAAIRCFIDHDSDTYSWPENRKIAAVAHRFCSAKADQQLGNFVQSGLTTGKDVFAESFRQTYQPRCERSVIETAKNAK